jgi:hypothetical protein
MACRHWATPAAPSNPIDRSVLSVCAARRAASVRRGMTTETKMRSFGTAPVYTACCRAAPMERATLRGRQLSRTLAQAWCAPHPQARLDVAGVRSGCPVAAPSQTLAAADASASFTRAGWRSTRAWARTRGAPSRPGVLAGENSPATRASRAGVDGHPSTALHRYQIDPRRPTPSPVADRCVPSTTTRYGDA